MVYFIPENLLRATPWFEVASMKKISSGSEPNLSTIAAWSVHRNIRKVIIFLKNYLRLTKLRLGIATNDLATTGIALEKQNVKSVRELYELLLRYLILPPELVSKWRRDVTFEPERCSDVLIKDLEPLYRVLWTICFEMELSLVPKHRDYQLLPVKQLAHFKHPSISFSMTLTFYSHLSSRCIHRDQSWGLQASLSLPSLLYSTWEFYFPKLYTSATNLRIMMVTIWRWVLPSWAIHPFYQSV